MQRAPKGDGDGGDGEAAQHAPTHDGNGGDGGDREAAGYAPTGDGTSGDGGEEGLSCLATELY